ncbi:4'-phosphopantetheinyl transferase family protein [Candidatus Nitrotoga arctica]|uniref:4'-phosphopantetheinyl transferase n=1 Tax=Candidatus Nitrotoga arctica TaxID=453162 RepID=A0ABN8ATK8_9PROT|nr:4'-phosphopantetheinyl transferase superfamily protein [Candidatus Nitrotoga arctica]CAG9933603.1 4'-phosphopantetheinyl transferase [Candidatus Nitrotoga arctica]
MPPQLQAGELHIWKIELDYDNGHWQPLMALLSDDEQIKADRYRFDKLRLRYIAGRAALRKLLGGYMGREPEALIFDYNDYGKPSLQNIDNGLCFNVSHSGETMLAAFVLNSEVGIDIEAIQQNIDYVDICQRWFSVQENNALQDLPEEQRIAAFFRAWTRKEAYIKARGIGLSYSLNRFSVSLDESSSALLEHHDCPQEIKSWQIYNIEVSSAYSAAVAIEAARWDIRHYNFEHLRKRA